MDCPVCKEAMITLELNQVEIDHCLGCGGIWLDSGELETLLGETSQAKIMINSFRKAPKSSEKARKCPICLKKMRKILAGSDKPTVLLDRCKKTHGLWFDKGELQDIFKLAKFDRENKVQTLLADMFGEDTLQVSQQ